MLPLDRQADDGVEFSKMKDFLQRCRQATYCELIGLVQWMRKESPAIVLVLVIERFEAVY